MAGKQAKILSNSDVIRLLRHVSRGRYADRDRVVVLLSVKAGFRAGEIAHLTWPMVVGPNGQIGTVIELHDRAAKKGSGRLVPMHPDLRTALVKLAKGADLDGPVITSERGGAVRPNTIVNWFAKQYDSLGLKGCSSHSGRRTFITNAARKIHKAGGSIRDVQELAGHRSLSMTASYIVGNNDAKRRLVRLI